MSDVQEYKKRIIELKQLRATSEGLKQQRSTVELEIDALENILKEMLAADDETSFKCDEGTIYLSFIDQVKMPQDPNQKQAFFDYLKDRGLYDDMISVNSQKLNGFYRKEAEAAKEHGEIIFNMPGIEGVHTVTRIGLRK